MAFLSFFAFDHKRWHEVDLLNDIIGFESLKNSKNWIGYDHLKLMKIHEMTYNLLDSQGIFHTLSSLEPKRELKYTSLRSLCKKNEFKMIKIDQVMLLRS